MGVSMLILMRDGMNGVLSFPFKNEYFGMDCCKSSEYKQFRSSIPDLDPEPDLPVRKAGYFIERTTFTFPYCLVDRQEDMASDTHRQADHGPLRKRLDTTMRTAFPRAVHPRPCTGSNAVTPEISGPVCLKGMAV